MGDMGHMSCHHDEMLDKTYHQNFLSILDRQIGLLCVSVWSTSQFSEPRASVKSPFLGDKSAACHPNPIPIYVMLHCNMLEET